MAGKSNHDHFFWTVLSTTLFRKTTFHFNEIFSVFSSSSSPIGLNHRKSPEPVYRKRYGEKRISYKERSSQSQNILMHSELIRSFQRINAPPLGLTCSFLRWLAFCFFFQALSWRIELILLLFPPKVIDLSREILSSFSVLFLVLPGTLGMQNPTTPQVLSPTKAHLPRLPFVSIIDGDY